MPNGSSNGASAMPVVLTIAGFDPCSGAGITADLKTLAAHNCYGVAAISALTVQNTSGVRSVEPVKGKILGEMLQAIAEDVHLAAVKIGMLGNAENARVVAAFLQKPDLPVVLDPVVQSSSGSVLLDEKGLKELRGLLMPRATVITPNLAEAALLAGFPVTNVEEMKKAAAELVSAGARAAIITGGHLEKPVDVLYDGQNWVTLPGDRVKTAHTHGTGCAFSSALAAGLAQGKSLAEAAVLAKAYVYTALERGFAVGAGPGSPDHLYRLHPNQVFRAGGAEPHHMEVGHR
jgi:hydroxymethylpyrimidine/phosphomethylpyrimidine kinase